MEHWFRGLVERMTRMKIAQIAPLIESVPPRLYGGTERIVSYLTEELVALGHDVTLFASGDSITAAKLVPCVPQGSAARPKRAGPDSLLHADARPRAAARRRFRHPALPHRSVPFSRCSAPIADRTVTTLHGRQDLPDLLPLYRRLQRHAAGFDLRCAARSRAESEFCRHRPSRPSRRLASPPGTAARRLSGLPWAHLAGEAPRPRHRHRARAGHSAQDRGQSRPRRRGLFSRRESSRCSRPPASNSSARSTSSRRRNFWATRRRCCSRSTGRSRSALS